MAISGIKFTHDGALALIDHGKLIFSYEMEKINNNCRILAFNLSLLYKSICGAIRRYLHFDLGCVQRTINQQQNKKVYELLNNY